MHSSRTYKIPRCAFTVLLVPDGKSGSHLMLTDNVFQTIHMIYLGRKNWLSSATLRTTQYRSLPINLRVLDELPPSEIFCLITVPLAKLSFNDRLLKDSLAVRGTDISIRVERHDVHTRYH